MLPVCPKYGRRNFNDLQLSTKWALSKMSQADHALLLTATPHHGDEDKFAHFLRLIDPDLSPEPHRLGKQAAAIRKDVFRLGKDSPWSLWRKRISKT
jgi:hypothetical protein